ncbi:hypothetical protein SKAU_G00387710 [Synaphobranchus kaupii]|uniref:Uncharacterized protein n=1 Tax=Synaphobranchus kaupii TaxID=118154 RepID=A0A9Q1ID95_SYNKA|nr:hypothetical protein SKAU_G00387710 [Synaphobranchus kaupii]
MRTPPGLAGRFVLTRASAHARTLGSGTVCFRATPEGEHVAGKEGVVSASSRAVTVTDAVRGTLRTGSERDEDMTLPCAVKVDARLPG